MLIRANSDVLETNQPLSFNMLMNIDMGLRNIDTYIDLLKQPPFSISFPSRDLNKRRRSDNERDTKGYRHSKYCDSHVDKRPQWCNNSMDHKGSPFKKDRHSVNGAGRSSSPESTLDQKFDYASRNSVDKAVPRKGCDYFDKSNYHYEDCGYWDNRTKINILERTPAKRWREIANDIKRYWTEQIKDFGTCDWQVLINLILILLSNSYLALSIQCFCDNFNVSLAQIEILHQYQFQTSIFPRRCLKFEELNSIKYHMTNIDVVIAELRRRDVSIDLKYHNYRSTPGGVENVDDMGQQGRGGEKTLARTQLSDQFRNQNEEDDCSNATAGFRYTERSRRHNSHNRVRYHSFGDTRPTGDSVKSSLNSFAKSIRTRDKDIEILQETSRARWNAIGAELLTFFDNRVLSHNYCCPKVFRS